MGEIDSKHNIMNNSVIEGKKYFGKKKVEQNKGIGSPRRDHRTGYSSKSGGQGEGIDLSHLRILGCVNSKCKGPEVEMCLPDTFRKQHKEISMARVEWLRRTEGRGKDR